MRFQEGVHGIFRDYNGRPTYVDVLQSEQEFRRNNKDYLEMSKRNFVLLPVFIIGMILFIITLKMGFGNLAMLIAAVTTFIEAIIICKINTNPFYPKSERNPVFTTVVVCLISLIVAVYNILCMAGIFGDEEARLDIGNNVFVAALLCGVAGFVITQLVYGIRMNIKCSASTEAYCVGYADQTVRRNKRNTVASRCVYEYSYNGENYYTPGKASTGLARYDLPAIGSSKTVRFDPSNPEFCMLKKAEIASFVKIAVVLAITGLITFYIVSTAKVKEERMEINKQKVEELYGDETTSDTTETSETTEETEPEPEKLTDAWILARNNGDENYVVVTYPVLSMENDRAYFGEQPCLPFPLFGMDGLEVGDEVMIIVYNNGNQDPIKLEMGEKYLGDHTLENLGYLNEEGKIVLSEDFMNFYAEGFKYQYVVTFTGMTDELISFANDEIAFDYNNSPEYDMHYWDLQVGDEFYMFEKNGNYFMFSAKMYVLP